MKLNQSIITIFILIIVIVCIMHKLEINKLHIAVTGLHSAVIEDLEQTLKRVKEDVKMVKGIQDNQSIMVDRIIENDKRISENFSIIELIYEMEKLK